jgi:ParB/RepB/Spo0J family partition protein
MIENILLEKIDADPKQPRQKFLPTELAELKNSIKEKGILVPLILESNYSKSDHFLLIDGERRYRCAKELKLKSLPASITKGPLTFEERTILRFHIQEQHKSWTIFDKAKAIYDFKRETNLSIVEIAQKLNTSAPRIHNWLSITDLTEESQKEVLSKNISFSYLIHLIKITKDYLSFSDLSQREIEEKLIQKIEAGIFNTVLDFQRFSRLMSTYTHYPEKLEFLNRVGMTLEEVLKKAELEKTIDLEIFYKSLVSIDRNLSKITNKKHKLSQEFDDILKVIRDKINKFL